LIWIFIFFKAVITAALLSPSKSIYLALLKREEELSDKNIQLNEIINELAISREALAESEMQLSNALDKAPIPIMLRNEEGKVLKLSKEWTNITGYTLSDIPVVDDWISKAYRDSDKDRKEVEKNIKTSYDRDVSKYPEYKIYTASGEKRIWQFHAANIGTDIKGQKVVITTAIDVTERKQNEMILKMNVERLQLLFERMSEGFAVLEIVFDEDKNPIDLIFTEANDALISSISVKTSTIIGSSVRDVFPYSGQEWIDRYGKLGDNKDSISFVDYLVETGKYCKVNAFYISNSQVGILFTDISIQKRTEIEMQKAKDNAIKASESKSQFLANMSHEIRTPMNGVLGMIQLIQETELTAEQEEIINISKRSSESLLAVINDILDYSKIEAGKVTLEHKVFDLNIVVDDVIKMFESSIRNKDLKLSKTIEVDVSTQLIGDFFKFRQILANLIGNAVKYTLRGRIDIRISNKMPTEESESHIEVQIKDTGIGICKEKQKGIFTSFSQGDNSNTREYGGTGLGLAITKGLVELMGGSIWLESEIGEGSEFIFTLKMKVNQSPKLEVTHKQLENNSINSECRILLVEDDKVSQIVAKKFLESRYRHVILAENGQEAYELISREAFDIILMDVQMPVMGGYEATKKIRNFERNLGRHTTIIAMTALAYEHDNKNAIEAGMNDFLSKPIEKDILYKKINHYWESC